MKSNESPITILRCTDCYILPVSERRLHEPLPDAEVLEAVLEPCVRHPDREALGGILGVGVEVEPQLAQPLERLGGGRIGILNKAASRTTTKWAATTFEGQENMLLYEYQKRLHMYHSDPRQESKIQAAPEYTQA